MNLLELQCREFLKGQIVFTYRQVSTWIKERLFLNKKDIDLLRIPTVWKLQNNYWAIGFEGDRKYFVPDFDTVILLFGSLLRDQGIHGIGHFGFKPNHPGIRILDKGVTCD